MAVEEKIGHRERCRKRLVSEGAENFSDTDILEMLLFYAVPRSDTRKTAEKLIEEFGTLDGVIRAMPEDVTRIPGLKENASVLLTLLRETVSRTSFIPGEADLLEGGLSDYLIKLFRGKNEEIIYALYFTEDSSFIGRQRIFCGTVSSVKFSLRVITEGALRLGSRGVVLAHNHPSGSLIPSGDDIISTNRIAAHLAANEITLINHYIVGEDRIVGIFDNSNML